MTSKLIHFFTVFGLSFTLRCIELPFTEGIREVSSMTHLTSIPFIKKSLKAVRISNLTSTTNIFNLEFN
jgi:hypothetical protein